MTTQTAIPKPQSRFSQYWTLTKPRVTKLAVFCAVIGMFLATDGFPGWQTLIAGTAGIWLLAAAAFAVNCLVEARVDARMTRTARRATASGELSTTQTVVFSSIIGGLGMLVLYTLVNPLTMWLTFVTFVGYAFIYTLLLKPNTSQNIVIGGLSGAMPPALGWAAVANEVPMEAWLLVLIIFMWTPPHFWVLAMYRREDYARSGLPMLPITHGMKFTGLQVWLYTIGLAATTLLPFAVGMSGLIYLAAAVPLNAVFLRHSWRVHRNYSDAQARKTFTWSIVYLSLLFAALLVDHYFKF
ncbi:heme o synthase [Massilia aurea]|jgi:protoheme IX farnesyltransferase|uniref:heme o synthase n=1 Tax=Massilia aurea TaxID=373040 RepID=UPI0019A05F9F|nr:heme o synthase [Massilia aurea]MBD8633101.1 protoheme IX farnesyltransferase [Oxalobacteraceae sp. CFBP 8755]MBD8655071.1 protoheme IX farnesyltransferase [Oxalobacteraceae sp. CFBP 13730]MCS0708237.1 heme o synthase [Massilia aurea]